MRKWRDNSVFVPEMRALAQNWCIERGLDPSDVPLGGYLEESGEGIRIEVFQRDENGTIKWDFDAADGEGRPYMEWKTVKGPMPHHTLLEGVL